MISDARLSIRADQAAITENILRITGEDTVSVARKHKENWDGKLPTKFIFATNELPHFSDTSSALAGRFIMFQLVRTFYGNEDTALTDKLKAELPGILMWALDGLVRLRNNGKLTQTESGKTLVKEMEELTSPVSMFVEEECVLDPMGMIPCHDLFDKWRSWCEENGRSHPGASNTFSRNLKATFSGIDTHKPTNAQKRVFRGIRLATGVDRQNSAY
jgi:putative DNA primase/helicase